MLRAARLSTLGYVLYRHRDESEDKARIDVLKRFLPGPALELVELRPFAEALGTSSGQLRTEICRLRKRYAVLLRGAIADTLALDAQDPDLTEAIDDEVRLLYRSLCDPPDAEVLLQH